MNDWPQFVGQQQCVAYAEIASNVTKMQSARLAPSYGSWYVEYLSSPHLPRSCKHISSVCMVLCNVCGIKLSCLPRPQIDQVAGVGTLIKFIRLAHGDWCN